MSSRKGYTRITDEERNRIRELRKSGMSYSKIANLVGKSLTAVYVCCSNGDKHYDTPKFKSYTKQEQDLIYEKRQRKIPFKDIANELGRTVDGVKWEYQRIKKMRPVEENVRLSLDDFTLEEIIENLHKRNVVAEDSDLVVCERIEIDPKKS